MQASLLSVSKVPRTVRPVGVGRAVATTCCLAHVVPQRLEGEWVESRDGRGSIVPRWW